jgi:hypothetical protein
MGDRLYVIRTAGDGYVVEGDSFAVLAWRDRPVVTDPSARIETFVPESEVDALRAEVERLKEAAEAVCRCRDLTWKEMLPAVNQLEHAVSRHHAVTHPLNRPEIPDSSEAN